jgi:hypothetical protein
MAAAGIGPKAAAMIFFGGALLKKHFTLIVENKNAEGTMQ